MNAQTKKELDLLIKTHEMTQEVIGAETTDAAMLATVVQMAKNGDDEMALYMLHHLKPMALEIEEAKKSEPADEQDEDILDLLMKALLS